jgi:hypothetical protein
LDLPAGKTGEDGTNEEEPGQEEEFSGVQRGMKFHAAILPQPPGM